MGASHKWLRIIRRKFLRSSTKEIILPRTSVCTNQSEEEAILRNEATTIEDLNLAMPTSSSTSTMLFTKEDVAAIKIQAYFRGHLNGVYLIIDQARRAYRALKSLVKLQALVRGVFVRRQSRIAMHCMHALVRLQVRVRAQQLLGQV